MRIFTVDDQVFTGFNKQFNRPQMIAVVREEDCINVWALDEPKAVQELKRYYISLQLPHQFIGIYTLMD